MLPPASARGALPPPSARPPGALSALASDPRLMLRGMVGGENIALARPPAGSAIVRARSQEC
eukprot:1439581-Pleurochrysis_carterae.AAC.1